MKISVKDTYKKTIMAKKIRGFFDLTRPFTLIAPLIGGTMGAIMGLQYTDSWHNFDLFAMLFGAITLALLNGASNSLNQVTDIEGDKINKPYRPIPRKIVTKKEALTISGLLYLGAILRAIWINYEFLSIISILALITVLYSCEPFRFKRRLWLNNIIIAIARGGLGIVAGWSIFTPINSPYLLACALVITVFLMGATTLKDLNDVKGDKQDGSNTLPVKYGLSMSVALVIPFAIASSLICFWFWLVNIFNSVGILLSISFLSIMLFLLFKGKQSGFHEQKLLENSWAWTLMYASIGITYALFLIMTFIG
jgi:geranylgeranylglycerol-phosphate geranylgeranyltransferase